MTGYRRVEPAFCRGCGIPWSPGATSCAACGEALERAQVRSGDPRAFAKLRAALVATGLVLFGRWITLWYLADIANGGDYARIVWLQIGAGAGLCALAVATARLWYPTGRRADAAAPSWTRIAIAAVGGVVLALGLHAGFGLDHLWELSTPTVLAWAAQSPAPLLVAVAGAIVAEEWLFRGWLVDGVSALGGPRNAAITSGIAYALYAVNPWLVVEGIVAAVVRAWTGSVIPTIALRLATAATLWAIVATST